MRLLLVVLILVAVIAVVAMRLAAAQRRAGGRAGEEPHPPLAGDTPQRDPEETRAMADPPPGSRGDRERHGKP